MAAYLGYEFVDAAEVIRFDKNGNLDSEKTDKLLNKRLSKCENAVVPGFYGAKDDGTVTTFSRGGSDVTGSLVAKAIKADMYENWTDVSGFLVTDPRIVKNPAVIETITVPFFAVELKALACFYPAEEFHQRYLEKHPRGYCHVAPWKLAALPDFPFSTKTYTRPAKELLQTWKEAGEVSF